MSWQLTQGPPSMELDIEQQAYIPITNAKPRHATNPTPNRKRTPWQSNEALYASTHIVSWRCMLLHTLCHGVETLHSNNTAVIVIHGDGGGETRTCGTWSSSCHTSPLFFEIWFTKKTLAHIRINCDHFFNIKGDCSRVQNFHLHQVHTNRSTLSTLTQQAT